MRVLHCFKRYLSETQGATAIEYGLIAAGIGLVIIPAVNLVGYQLEWIMDRISCALLPSEACH